MRGWGWDPLLWFPLPVNWSRSMYVSILILSLILLLILNWSNDPAPRIGTQWAPPPIQTFKYQQNQKEGGNKLESQLNKEVLSFKLIIGAVFVFYFFVFFIFCVCKWQKGYQTMICSGRNVKHLLNTLNCAYLIGKTSKTNLKKNRHFFLTNTQFTWEQLHMASLYLV